MEHEHILNKLDKIYKILEADFNLRRRALFTQQRQGFPAGVGGALGGFIGALLGSGNSIDFSRLEASINQLNSSVIGLTNTLSASTPTPPAVRQTPQPPVSTSTPSGPTPTPSGPTPTPPGPVSGTPTPPVGPTSGTGPVSPVGPLGGLSPAIIAQLAQLLRLGFTSTQAQQAMAPLHNLPADIYQQISDLIDAAEQQHTAQPTQAGAIRAALIQQIGRLTTQAAPSGMPGDDIAEQIESIFRGTEEDEPPTGPGGVYGSMIFPPVWQMLPQGMQDAIGNIAGGTRNFLTSISGGVGMTPGHFDYGISSLATKFKGSAMTLGSVAAAAAVPYVIGGIREAAARNEGGGILDYDAARRQAQAGAQHPGGVMREGAQIAHTLSLGLSESASAIGRTLSAAMRVF